MWNNVFYSNYQSSYGSNYLQSRTENYTNPNSPIAKSKNIQKDSFTKTILTAGGIAIAGISKLLKTGRDFLLKYLPKK